MPLIASYDHLCELRFRVHRIISTLLPFRDPGVNLELELRVRDDVLVLQTESVSHGCETDEHSRHVIERILVFGEEHGADSAAVDHDAGDWKNHGILHH